MKKIINILWEIQQPLKNKLSKTLNLSCFLNEKVHYADILHELRSSSNDGNKSDTNCDTIDTDEREKEREREIDRYKERDVQPLSESIERNKNLTIKALTEKIAHCKMERDKQREKEKERWEQEKELGNKEKDPKVQKGEREKDKGLKGEKEKDKWQKGEKENNQIPPTIRSIPNKSDEKIENYKSIDELYNYIVGDNSKKDSKKRRNKKKNTPRKNTNATEDNNCSNITNDNSLSSNDPIVESFKFDLSKQISNAKQVIKIKPVLTHEWIEYISLLDS